MNLDNSFSINNFMTKGEVEVIILEGHSNQAFLAAAPIYGKTEITTRDRPVHKFKLFEFSSTFREQSKISQLLMILKLLKQA